MRILTEKPQNTEFVWVHVIERGETLVSFSAARDTVLDFRHESYEVLEVLESNHRVDIKIRRVL